MPRYPLEPLAQVRKKKVEEATAALAGAVCKREAAARVLRTAEVRMETALRAASRVRTAELEALTRGELRASDLARGHVWAARAAAEERELAEVVRRAEAAEAAARDREREAQGTLSTRRAEALLVDGHRERWNERHHRGALAREEEASSEAWRRQR
jgi:hypothetical protein